MDDGALLEAWRAGERGAGQALIRRHYAAIFRFFYGKVPVAQCEDLAQQTFEVVCRRPDGYRGEGTFRAYLFGVARFVLLAWVRRHHRHVSPAEELLAGDDPSPSGVLLERQTLRLVATALRTLALDEQILIELKDWEGLAQAELAALFGVPQPTVARRLQRARARLRAAVEALCSDPARREHSLRNLDSCMASIRAQIDARWGRAGAAEGE